MTSKDIRYFNVAKSIALTSEYKRIKIGCIVVLKKHIISVGCNSYKTHTKQRYYNQFRWDIKSLDTPHSLHAEIQALININKGIDLGDAVLYNYREHVDGTLANSRPCESCMRMIKDMNIKKIYYTTEDGYAMEYLTDN